MIGDVVCYCLVKEKLPYHLASAVPLSTFEGKVCRVMEFSKHGPNGEIDGALVMNNEATGICMLEKEHMKAFFECSIHCDIICPPNSSC